MPTDEHYLDHLLGDLTRKINETPDQRHKVIEMGCFVEVVHRALQQCLLKKPSKPKNETLEAYWQRHLDQFSARLSITALNRLSGIYGARNKCAHPPKYKRDLTERDAAISLAASDMDSLVLSELSLISLILLRMYCSSSL